MNNRSISLIITENELHIVLKSLNIELQLRRSLLNNEKGLVEQMDRMEELYQKLSKLYVKPRLIGETSTKKKPRKCPTCGKSIEHKHLNARFCCTKCKDRYHNTNNPRGYYSPDNKDIEDDDHPFSLTALGWDLKDDDWWP